MSEQPEPQVRHRRDRSGATGHNLLMPERPSCAACGARSLASHLKVAGAMGREGLIPSTQHFGTALADIWRCSVCGHMQLQPMPSEALLAESYGEAASDDYVEEEAGQRATARRALERIEAHATRGGRLLDLGCWVGFLIAEARERGWSAVGVEPSAFAARYARERLRLEVIQADLFSADLPEHEFDAVTLGDVIEHLPRPGDALVRIRELLAGDGVLWLALPDAGSLAARVLGRRWWSVLPTHVQYFTRQSIAALLEREGFELLEVSTAPKAFTVNYYLGRVAGYSRGLSRVMARTAASAGIADRIWAPDFRDRMAVIARLRNDWVTGAHA